MTHKLICILAPLTMTLAVLGGCASDDAAFGDTASGAYLKGRFAAKQRALPEAAASFAAAAERSVTPLLDDQAFLYALAAGEMDAAVAYARGLIAREATGDEDVPPGAPDVLFARADLPRLTLAAEAMKRGAHEEARALLEGPLTSGLGRSLGHLLTAWAIYAEEGREAGQAHLLDVPEGVFGGFVPLHLAVMADLEDDPAAAAIYAEAQRTPVSSLAVLGAAGFFERHDEEDRAARLYRRMSEDQGIVRRAGRLGLARLGEPLDGETKAFLKTAGKARRELADDAASAASLAFANFAQTMYERAIQESAAAERAGFSSFDPYLDVPLAFARLASHLDPRQSGAVYLAGAVAKSYDQPALSAKILKGVPPHSWYYNYAAIDRADALVELGRTEEAIGLLKDYVSQDALAPDVLVTLSFLLRDEGRIVEAEAAATRALEVAGSLASDETRAANLWRYYFVRGAGYVETDQWEKGRADLEAALALAPEEPDLLNYLGYSFVERGENLEEALEMIERALDLDPNSGAITDSLGWAYYQLGDYDRAVELLERAVTLSPGDDVITDHLGDAYWQTGRRTEAAYEWRRVLEIEDAEPAVVEGAREKLGGEPPAPGTLAGQSDV